jgi:hypothetical protein
MKIFLILLLLVSGSALAQKTVQSGMIYKTHPDVEVIRKLAALYQKGDAEGMAKFYDSNVQFTGMSRYMPGTKARSKNLAEAKAGWYDIINNWQDLKMTETQAPIGLQFKDEPFTVQSWWLITMVNKKTKKKAGVDMVLFDKFNKEGKIISQLQYYDPSSLIAATK